MLRATVAVLTMFDPIHMNWTQFWQSCSLHSQDSDGKENPLPGICADSQLVAGGNAETQGAGEQKDGFEPHLKTKYLGWIGGLGSTCRFAIQWIGS